MLRGILGDGEKVGLWHIEEYYLDMFLLEFLGVTVGQAHIHTETTHIKIASSKSQ